jgi:hypothetical protein
MTVPTPIAQRACERSCDWRRGAAGSPDPDYIQSGAAGLIHPDPDALLPDPDSFPGYLSSQSLG